MSEIPTDAEPQIHATPNIPNIPDVPADKPPWHDEIPNESSLVAEPTPKVELVSQPVVDASPVPEVKMQEALEDNGESDRPPAQQVSDIDTPSKTETPKTETHKQSVASAINQPAFAELVRTMSVADAQTVAEQWIVFIEELTLSQNALNMVNCCAVAGVNDTKLELSMPKVQDVWHSQENIDELVQALRSYLGSANFVVEINLIEEPQEPLNTPMAMMQQKERERELAAEQAIANDVDVQYFLKQMGGKIVPHTTKSLKVDEPFYNE